MRKNIYILVMVLSGFLTACSKNAPTVSEKTSGDFTLLTYNVAGLPEGISPSNPEKNIPLMSPLLNKYDIAFVQEDFFYHEELKSKAQHPFQTDSNNGAGQFDFGDGLNRFSTFSLNSFRRQEWSTCSNDNGNDCLARKGFSWAKTEIAPGVGIDIYNVHLDSGGSQEDFSARDSQLKQLLTVINANSTGKAIIVAGDTNLKTETRPEDEQFFQGLLDGAGLTDACRSHSCDNEQVDRVLFRSSASLNLNVISWKIDTEFVDEQGIKLSDHNAVSVAFSWRVR